MEQENAKFGHSFNLIENMGAVRLKIIFDLFNGSFQEAWEAGEGALNEKIKNPELVKLILEKRENINPEKEWQTLAGNGISAITMNGFSYPPFLKEIPFPPALLYYKGDLSELVSNSDKSVSVVGTRRASFYGLETAFKLSRDLAAKGVSVISGLALGIDARAHSGCLEGGGKTFAVLGSGLLEIQPKTNLMLSEKIVKSGGALISEYPPRLVADKWTFPQRNRIIAGLSKLTVVIEAPEKSGALITAKFALDANRDIAVTPGEITSIVSKGSNKLLKQGAYPALCAEDIFEILGFGESGEQAQSEFLDEDETKIISGFVKKFAGQSELLKASGLEVSIFNQKITMLEIKGALKSAPGGFEKTC